MDSFSAQSYSQNVAKPLEEHSSAVDEMQPVTYNFSVGGQQIRQTRSPNHTSGFLKLLILLSIPLLFTAAIGLFITNQNQEQMVLEQNNVVMVIPMKMVNWQDLGNVFEPVVSLPIKTKSGYDSMEFLLDSGAVISSLPRDWAEKMGKDLAFMKRSTFKGFGGKTSFAYQGEMTVLINEEDKVIPVVFTEAVGTKSLLGRKGFFEQYSIVFNHQTERIEIRQ